MEKYGDGMNCPFNNPNCYGGYCANNMNCNNSHEPMMQPYMYGNCAMPYMCNEMYMNNCRGDYATYMNPNYSVQKMEPIQNLYGPYYKFLIVYVNNSVERIMSENMGMMPKSISKERYNREMDNMICDVMKNETQLKKIVVIDRSETDEEENLDRAFCPYCNGMIRDTLGLLFISQLLRGGCLFCY